MENQHNGEVELKINGKVYTIVYDWNALAKIKVNLSDKQILAVMQGEDLSMLGEVLAIGLQKHHNGITANEVNELSPPFILAVEAVTRAMNIAYYGPNYVDVLRQSKDNETLDDEKKTNRKTRRAKKTKTK